MVAAGIFVIAGAIFWSDASTHLSNARSSEDLSLSVLCALVCWVVAALLALGVIH